MSARLRLTITRRASRDILKALDWWKANRPKAPDALQDEIDRACDLIRGQPGVGAFARNVKTAGVRRIQLGRVRYYLYYREDRASGAVVVLALWHISRGSGPVL